jgi:serine/threonine protein kinase
METTTQLDVPAMLARSRLFTAEEAQAVYQRWLDEANDGSGDLEEFTRWLSAQRYVTEYQAALLGKGHTEGYFLSDYKILERIGRGRMAGVYKAVHNLGQTVAIKVLPPSRARDAELLGRFQREARLALRLKHANVVRAFQMGEADGCYYLVMEYLVGETLEEVFQRRRRLPYQEAIRLVHQLLLGLEHMHEQGFVHRDVKPANLMVVPAPPPDGPDTTEGSSLKILDIGLVRVFTDDVRSPEDNPLLTSAGAVLGTPDYMAPEQARDARSADIRADIYSAGCVLYHALTGQPPFPDTNLISQMVRHATEQAKPLSEFDISVPEGLQSILDRLLAKDPAERWQRPEDAGRALLELLSSGAAASPSPDASPQMNDFLHWLDLKSAGATTASLPAVTVAPSDAKVITLENTPTPRRRNSKVVTPSPDAAATDKMEPITAQATPIEARRSKVEIEPNSEVEPTNNHNEVNEPAPPALDVEAPPFSLNRRDFIMFSVGAGSTLGAVLLARMLSHLSHGKQADGK